MTGVRNARDTLHAGFTSVRDVGNYRAFVDVALRDAIDAGWLPGPRMMVAGAFIGCRGGGGDISGLAPDAAEHVPAELRVGIVDTVDDVTSAVRRILYGGADLIKLIATGAVMSDSSDPGVPELERGPDPRRGRGGHPARRPRGGARARRRGDQAGRPGRRALDRARLPDGRRGRRADGRGGHLAGRRHLRRRLHRGVRPRARLEGRRAAQERRDHPHPARGLREVRGGGRPDRLRHRQRHLPARAERPPARLPRPARPDAPRGDPVGHPPRRRADGLVGPDRPHRAGAVRRPGRGRGRPARRRTAARGRLLRDEGRRGRPRSPLVRRVGARDMENVPSRHKETPQSRRVVVRRLGAVDDRVRGCRGAPARARWTRRGP